MGNNAPHLNIDKEIPKDLASMQNIYYKDITNNMNYKVKSAFIMDPKSFWHDNMVHCRYLGELSQLRQVSSQQIVFMKESPY